MLEIGMNIADRYEIVGKVGAGGMSDVYKAKDHVLSRFVAIKVLKAEFSEDRNFVTKFRTEAQSAAGLEHPNIVNIYDVGSENGMHYIVMEHVEGITLKTYVEKKGQLTFKESISIAIQVARGIEAAHSKHLIHRDIKPQNIIISTEGKVKVTDFGIARAASSNTISADVMGSVHYASPEQARNGFVDGRSDIYSLGIVMYEMVTGRVPFDGDTTVAVALQHLQEEMISPKKFAPNLPISLEKIIIKCTQKNPDRRYQTIEELLNDLRQSLMNPDSDFVVMAPLVDNSKTKIISQEDLEEIKERRGVVASQEQSKSDDLDLIMDEENEEPEEVEEDYDEEEDEKGINPKLDRAINISMAIVGVIIVIVIIVIIASLVGLFNPSGSDDSNSTVPGNAVTEAQNTPSNQTQNTEPEMVEMINIVGDTKETAQTKLAARDLQLAVSETRDSDQNKDTVLEQSVEEGTQVAKGSTIYVIVAGDNTQKVNVPNVVNYNGNDAEKEIKAYGLKCEMKYEYDSSVERDHVISQDPASGDSVDPGSTVTLLISQGPEPATVPSVLGATKDSAESSIKNAGLVASVTEDYSSTVPEGNVISQTPEEQQTVEQGSTVSIVVSKGPEIVYYTCEKKIDVEEGATSCQITLKASDGTELYSGSKDLNGQSNITITYHNIAKYTSGWLEVVWYKVPESSQEEGTAVSDEPVAIGSRRIDVEFTKQDSYINE